MNRLYRQLCHFTVFGLVGIIAITARPAVGNESDDLIDQKIKITGYRYPNLDLYNLVAYLTAPDRNFVMPCNQAITISTSVVDPDHPHQELALFTDTVPANTASTCTTNRYRAIRPGPDVYELSMERQSPTSVYFYLYAVKGNYLPAQRAAMTGQAFLNYFARIKKTKITVQFSDGRSWWGWSDGAGAVTPWNKQKPCPSLIPTVYSAKVELRCNR